jgi:hypothetical protein
MKFPNYWWFLKDLALSNAFQCYVGSYGLSSMPTRLEHEDPNSGRYQDIVQAMFGEDTEGAYDTRDTLDTINFIRSKFRAMAKTLFVDCAPCFPNDIIFGTATITCPGFYSVGGVIRQAGQYSAPYIPINPFSLGHLGGYREITLKPELAIAMAFRGGTIPTINRRLRGLATLGPSHIAGVRRVFLKKPWYQKIISGLFAPKPDDAVRRAFIEVSRPDYVDLPIPEAIPTSLSAPLEPSIVVGTPVAVFNTASLKLWVYNNQFNLRIEGGVITKEDLAGTPNPGIDRIVVTPEYVFVYGASLVNTAIFSGVALLAFTHRVRFLKLMTLPILESPEYVNTLNVEEKTPMPFVVVRNSVSLVPGATNEEVASEEDKFILSGFLGPCVFESEYGMVPFVQNSESGLGVQGSMAQCFPPNISQPDFNTDKDFLSFTKVHNFYKYLAESNLCDPVESISGVSSLLSIVDKTLAKYLITGFTIDGRVFAVSNKPGRIDFYARGGILADREIAEGQLIFSFQLRDFDNTPLQNVIFSTGLASATTNGFGLSFTLLSENLETLGSHEFFLCKARYKIAGIAGSFANTDKFVPRVNQLVPTGPKTEKLINGSVVERRAYSPGNTNYETPTTFELGNGFPYTYRTEPISYKGGHFIDRVISYPDGSLAFGTHAVLGLIAAGKPRDSYVIYDAPAILDAAVTAGQIVENFYNTVSNSAPTVSVSQSHQSAGSYTLIRRKAIDLLDPLIDGEDVFRVSWFPFGGSVASVQLQASASGPTVSVTLLGTTSYTITFEGATFAGDDSVSYSNSTTGSIDKMIPNHEGANIPGSYFYGPDLALSTFKRSDNVQIQGSADASGDSAYGEVLITSEAGLVTVGLRYKNAALPSSRGVGSSTDGNFPWEISERTIVAKLKDGGACSGAANDFSRFPPKLGFVQSKLTLGFLLPNYIGNSQQFNATVGTHNNRPPCWGSAVFVDAPAKIIHCGGNLVRAANHNKNVGGILGDVYTPKALGFDLVIGLDDYNDVPFAEPVMVCGDTWLGGLSGVNVNVEAENMNRTILFSNSLVFLNGTTFLARPAASNATQVPVPAGYDTVLYTRRDFSTILESLPLKINTVTMTAGVSVLHPTRRVSVRALRITFSRDTEGDAEITVRWRHLNIGILENPSKLSSWWGNRQNFYVSLEPEDSDFPVNTDIRLHALINYKGYDVQPFALSYFIIDQGRTRLPALPRASVSATSVSSGVPVVLL